MTEQPKPPRRGSIRWMLANPGTRTYLIVGFAALLIFFLMMASKAGEIGAILIVLLAVPGMIGGWVASPAFVLILSTYMLIDPYFDGLTSFVSGYRSIYFGGQRGAPTPAFRFEDILLALSGLAYLIAHYRLQGLAFRVLPFEPRIRRKGEAPDADYPRPVKMVTDMEIGFVLMLAVMATVLGQIGWVLLAGTERSLAVSSDILVVRVVARLMLFVFVVGVAIAASSALFGYLRWNQMSKAEARLCLQDHTWQETRREQERIHRWRKWRRKREGIAEGEVRK